MRYRKRTKRGRKRKKRVSFGGLILLLPVIIAAIIIYIMTKRPNEGGNRLVSYGISNELSVRKDGVLINTLTDSRVEDYGDGTSYETYINNLVEEFNASGLGNPVTVNSIKIKKEGAVAILEFPDYKTFSGLNGYPVFWGTLSEAIEEGYEFESPLTSTLKNEEFVNAQDIDDKDKRNVFICTVISGENLQVSVPSNIKYYDNVVLEDKNTAKLSDDVQSVLVW